MQQLQQLTKQLQKLKKEYSSTTASDGLQKITKDAKHMNENNKSTKSQLSGLISLGGKLKTVLISAFSWRNIIEMSQYASDYIETLNLFEVSLGKVTDEYGNLDKVSSKYYERAIKFQNTLEEKLGVNRRQTMQYQALFNQMSKSMGISDEYSYMLSENFTKLGLDLSSLFNISEELAMSKLRAGLAGQTKPLRDLGLDITQQSLQPIANELGLEKSIKQLNQAEKMCLRYIAVLRQTTAAQGDMAKTVESQANQMRIFNNQLTMLKINVGQFFNGLISSILPYVNGILMVINALIKTFASFLGIEMKAVNGVSSVTSGISEDLGNATDKAKEFKAQLMGFDEIHNITLDTGDSNSGAGSLGGAVDQRILEAMKEYDNLMADVDMKATQIRDKIMEWLGFTKEINPETGEITWKLNDGYTNIEKIGTVLKGLGIIVGLNKILKIINAIASSPLLKLIKSIFNFLSKIKGLKAMSTLGKHAKEAGGAFSKFSSILKPLGGIISVVSGAFLWLGGIFDIIKDKGTPLIQFLKILGGTLLVVGGLLLLGVALIPSLIVGAIMLIIAGIVALIKHWDEVKTWCKVFFTETLPEFFTKKIPEIWNNFIKWLGEKWQEFINWLSNVPEKIGYWIGFILGTVVKFFTKTIPNAWKTFWKWIGKKWQEFATWILSIPEKIGYWLGFISGTIAKFFTETIPNAWKNFWNWIGKKWQEFMRWFSEIPGKIKNKIAEIGETIAKFFTETIPEKWEEFWEWIKELPGQMWQIGVDLVRGLIDGIKSMLETAKNEVKDFCGGLVQGFKDALGIHSPSRVMKDEIGFNLIEGLKQGLLSNSMTSTISYVLRNIKTNFQNGMNTFRTIGSNIIGGIKSGITSASNKLKSTITTLAGNISSWFKSKLNINSPSRVLRDEVGKFIPLGIAEGIKKESDSIYSTIEDIKNEIVTNAQTIGIETSSMVDYGTINGSISTQTEANINSGFAREVATSIISALKQSPLKVDIVAKTEEGVIVKKASKGFTEYFNQNGELPFPT